MNGGWEPLPLPTHRIKKLSLILAFRWPTLPPFQVFALPLSNTASPAAKWSYLTVQSLFPPTMKPFTYYRPKGSPAFQAPFQWCLRFPQLQNVIIYSTQVCKTIKATKLLTRPFAICLGQKERESRHNSFDFLFFLKTKVPDINKSYWTMI